MPVSLPANVLGFYTLATRMVAAVAELRGYDVDTRCTRAAVMLSLVGGDAEELMRKAGVSHGHEHERVQPARAPGGPGCRRRPG